MQLRLLTDWLSLAVYSSFTVRPSVLAGLLMRRLKVCHDDDDDNGQDDEWADWIELDWTGQDRTAFHAC